MTDTSNKSAGDAWLSVAAASVPLMYVLGHFYVIRSTSLLAGMGTPKLYLTINQAVAPQFCMLLGIVGAALLFGRVGDFLDICAFANWRVWFVPMAAALEVSLFLPFAALSFLSLMMLRLLRPFAASAVDAALELSRSLQLFMMRADWDVFCAVAATALVVAPIVEEIVFRGVVFNYLSRRLGMWGAMFATSFIFAAFHLNALSFIVLFTLGMVLQTLYVKTKSIFPCMIFHSVHNGVAIGLITLFKLGLLGKGADSILGTLFGFG